MKFFLNVISLLSQSALIDASYRSHMSVSGEKGMKQLAWHGKPLTFLVDLNVLLLQLTEDRSLRGRQLQDSLNEERELLDPCLVHEDIDDFRGSYEANKVTKTTTATFRSTQTNKQTNKQTQTEK